MTDPSPSQYNHLGELLTLMRDEMRRGFADLKDELSDRVSVDVYEADKRLAEERAERAAADLAAVRAEVKAAEAQRAADRRMVWGALLTAGLSFVVGAVLLVLQVLTRF